MIPKSSSHRIPELARLCAVLLVLIFAQSPGKSQTESYKNRMDTVMVTVGLSSDTALLSDTLLAWIEIRSEGYKGRRPSFNILDKIPTRDLNIVSSRHAHSFSKTSHSEIYIDRFEYVITPQTIGMAYLDAMLFSYSYPPDTNIYFLAIPEMGVLIRNSDSIAQKRFPLPWLVAGSILATVIAVGAWHNLKKKITVEEDGRRRKDIAQKYLDRLGLNRSRNLKKQYAEIQCILREFICEYTDVESLAPTFVGMKDALEVAGLSKFAVYGEELEQTIFAREMTEEDIEMKLLKLKNLIREKKGEDNES